MKTILVFAFLACVFSCNHQKQKIEPPPTPSSPQIIRVCNPGDLASLHPHTGIDLNCRLFQKALFEGLTRLDLSGKPVLAGAAALEISPSQIVYTFTLRPMKWTNSEKVTAHHFEKAWKSALTPNSDCLRSDLFYLIKGAKRAKMGEISLREVGIYAQDDQTLIVELEHPAPYFLELLAHPLFSPLYDEEPSPHVFNGPFFVARWDLGKSLLLQKNYSYWDSSQVHLDKIEVAMVADANTALMLYQKGEIDWAGHPFTLLPDDALPRLKASQEFHSEPIDGVYWLCLNTEKAPLSSAKIRKALSLALDREALAHHLLCGETPCESILPTGMALLGNWEPSDHSLHLAQSLFEEGLEELHLRKEDFPTLEISHSDMPWHKKLSEAIQESWHKSFQIDVTLHNSDWNHFFASLGERRFQIGGCIWYSVYHDPIYNLEFFKEKKHRYNAPQWENIHFQKLLQLAEGERDLSQRLEHLKEAEQLLLDEMPIIPLFVYHAKYLKSPHLHGLEVLPAGYVDFKYARIE